MAFKPVNFERLARFNSDASSKLLNNYEQMWKTEIQENRKDIPSKTYAPSSLRCKRRSWFRRRGVMPDGIFNPDTGLDFSAMVGTACHRYIQNLLKYNLKSDWVSVSDYIQKNSNNLMYPVDKYAVTADIEGLESKVSLLDPPVNFACDGVIRLNGNIYLLEIKTCEFSIWEDMVEPRSEHIDQVKCYASILGIHNILMLYQDRQYGSIKCYEITSSDTDKDDLKHYFNDVETALQTNIAPKGLPVGDKWCNPNMCPYYKKCQEYGRG